MPYTIHIETNQKSLYDLMIDLILVCSATFSNISAIQWRPVLVVEESRVPRENHRPLAATDTLYHLRLRVECIFSVIYKAGWERTPYW